MFEILLCHYAETDDFPFYIQYGGHQGSVDMHRHVDFTELVVVLEGSAMHVVGHEKYPVSEGDVFVIDKYTHHGFVEAKDFRICNIMFKPEVLFEHIFHIRQNAGFHALFVLEPYYAQNHQFCSRLKLEVNDFASIKKLIAEIVHEHTHKSDGWQTLCFAKFIQLCTILSRLYQSYDIVDNNNILKLATAVAYIEKNYCSDISIAKLAETTGYSERQFCRLFKSAFSASPNTFITNLRLQKAQQLLKTTSLPVGEISWTCGYADHNYFSRIFKKYIGLSPSEYRENTLW